MAKTAAERQRAYRERKKQQDPNYLKAESARVKGYYVNASQLAPRSLASRNAVAAARNRVCRLKKKLKAAEQQSQPLVVHLPAVKKQLESLQSPKGSGVKKTRKRALARAHKKMKTMEEDLRNLSKKIRAKNKQIERLKAKCITDSPKSKIAMEVNRLAGLSPRRKSSLCRRLLLGSAVLEEIKEAKGVTRSKGRRPLHNILAGKITKKYRLIKAISSSTGLSRTAMLNSKSKTTRIRSELRQSVTKEMQAKVTEFLTREDNARTQPGKADAKKTGEGTEKAQTYVLTDYLANLHSKFLAENPDTKLSLASFCRMRPRHILLAAFISRNACQCQRHQNMALKVNALRKLGVGLSQNPDKLVETEPANIIEMLAVLPATVPYKTWKRVSITDKGKEFQKMKIVEQSANKEAFIEDFKKDLEDFRNHTQRVKKQYAELRNLKQNLPLNEAMIQMDFSENFTCRSLEEIQSAYWNQTSVTIHPAVIYFRDKEGEVQHKSVVTISDEGSHSASTVCAFLDDLMTQVKEVVPQCEKVHYWTDSPSSQYRNRFIFYTISRHQELYGVTAVWNYFEAGHGKGPCDGLGGTTKRMADESVRQGKCIIQQAADFFRWSVTSTMKGIIFRYVEKDTCEEKKKILQSDSNIKPVKESMRIHAVVGISPAKILTASVSCYCPDCLKGNYCHHWAEVSLEKKKIRHAKDPQEPASKAPEEEMPQGYEPQQPQEPQEPAIEATDNEEAVGSQEPYRDGETVACLYGDQWYLGKVEEVDHEEQEIFVNFYEKAKNHFRWPSRPDRLWIKYQDVLCTVADPQPTRKSKRHFSITREDQQIIEDRFKSV